MMKKKVIIDFGYLRYNRYGVNEYEARMMKYKITQSQMVNFGDL